MAPLAMAVLVTGRPDSTRAVITLVSAEVLAVLAAMAWSRWAARRGRADLVVGAVVVAVSGLLFAVTPAGLATAVLATLLGAGVGTAMGPVPGGHRDLRSRATATGALVSAVGLLVAVEAVAGSWAWSAAVALVVLAGLQRRAAAPGSETDRPTRTAALLRWSAVVAAAGLLVWTGANDPQLSWFGPVVSHGPRSERRVALTFDDGPNGAFTTDVARILDQHGAKGTFFLVGSALDAQPDVARALMADGHVLGGHSYHHDYWRWLDPRYPELDRTVEAFRRDLGICPRFYRPPHGQRTPFMTARLAMDGMTDVTWDVSGADWITDDPDVLAERILDRVRPGSIVLLHDGLDGRPGADRSVVVEALPAILAGLERRGMTPVTVDEMIGGPAYLEDCRSGKS